MCAGVLNGATGATAGPSDGVPSDALTMGLGDAPVDNEQDEGGTIGHPDSSGERSMPLKSLQSRPWPAPLADVMAASVDNLVAHITQSKLQGLP